MGTTLGIKSFRHTLPLGQLYPCSIDSGIFLNKYAELGNNVTTVDAAEILMDDWAHSMDLKFNALKFMPQQYIWVYPDTASTIVDLVLYGIDVSEPHWPMQYIFIRISNVSLDKINDLQLILRADFQVRETIQ